jgi:deoxyribose-phosphate aldolase
MIDPLLDLTAEIRARCPFPSKTGRAQLLGCTEGHGLIRDGAGLHHRVLELIGLPHGPWDLSPLIDHTLLKAEAMGAQVEVLCGEALDHGFASVCVNPLWVPLAASLLKGSPVRTCTVVGFPLGAAALRAKAFEAETALREGAQEVDMVLAIGAAKAGLDFVKTSTGFSTGGASTADVALMRRTVGSGVGVKASGGIRTYETALQMVLAGATRLGLSASVTVVQGGGGPRDLLKSAVSS